MSDSDREQDASVLGKRARNGDDAENIKPADVEDRPDAMDADDDDDDDVGPMPMPAGADGHVVKKKRKGMCRSRETSKEPTCSPDWAGTVVLPHEKLYLEHLPNADRYYKSFMHRDVINFNVFTRYVACTRPLRPSRRSYTYPRVPRTPRFVRRTGQNSS